MNPKKSLFENFGKIYQRADKPRPSMYKRDLPWNGPAFSERILSEHLDESHGAASRVTSERGIQLDWLWQKLALFKNAHLFDVTCGPGLYAIKFAKRGCRVIGVDFNAAAIAYAKDLALSERVASKCTFIEQDVRQLNYDGENFDAAILLYGQLDSFARQEAETLLQQIAYALKPGGKLCIEILNQAEVDKTDSTWWFTDDQGLWADDPFLHLGERFWYEDEQMSVERYYIVHLETGEMDEVFMCTQTYSVEDITEMMQAAGFSSVQAYPAWDGLPLYDATEWMVYVAEK